MLPKYNNKHNKALLRLTDISLYIYMCVKRAGMANIKKRLLHTPQLVALIELFSWMCDVLQTLKQISVLGKGKIFFPPSLKCVDQPPFQCVPGHFPPGVDWSWREAENLPAWSSEVKNGWSCTSDLPHAFAACTGTTSSLHYSVEQRMSVAVNPSLLWVFHENGNSTFLLIPSALLTPLQALVVSSLCFGNVAKWFCAAASRLKWLQTLKPYVLDCLRNSPWSEIIN